MVTTVLCYDKREKNVLKTFILNPDGGDPVKLFDVKGIDISEEIDQRNKMSLSLHLVSF